MSLRALPLTLCAAVALSGCYTYTPLGEGPPPAGQAVRLHLSSQAVERITEATGIAPARAVSGTVVAATPDSLALDVWWGNRFAGTPFAERRDTLSLGRPEILELRARSLSRTKTALLIGGAVVSTAVLFRSFDGGGSSGTPPGGGIPPAP